MVEAVAWKTSEISALIAEHKDRPGALLPVLHAVQNHIGYIPETLVPLIAESLYLTRAEVHGVISFYAHFHSKPTGQNTVEICRAEACQAVGCRSLEAHAKATLGVDYHQTTACGSITLEPVYCLGNCATGPSIRINDNIYGRVDPERFDALVAMCRDQLEAVS